MDIAVCQLGLSTRGTLPCRHETGDKNLDSPWPSLFGGEAVTQRLLSLPHGDASPTSMDTLLELSRCRKENPKIYFGSSWHTCGSSRCAIPAMSSEATAEGAVSIPRKVATVRSILSVPQSLMLFMDAASP